MTEDELLEAEVRRRVVVEREARRRNKNLLPGERWVEADQRVEDGRRSMERRGLLPVRVNQARPDTPPAVDLSRFAVLAVRVGGPRYDTHMRAWTLDVEVQVPDRDSGRPIWVGGGVAVAEEILRPGGARLWADAVRRAVMGALEHELDECMRVDGLPWRDPHGGDAL